MPPIYIRSEQAVVWLKGGEIYYLNRAHAGVVNKKNVYHEVGLLVSLSQARRKRYDNFLLLHHSIAQEIKVAVVLRSGGTD